jgi:hypothetical protein
MFAKSILFSLLVLCGVLCLSCGSGSANHSAQANGTPAEAPPAQTPAPPTPAPNTAPGFYLGCWTAGDGTHLAVTETTIQTDKTGKPLRYKDVTDDATRQKGVRLLEIEDKDASGQFFKYVSFEPKGDDELQGRGYESMEDFRNSYPKAVYARWGKDDCKGVMPMLKGGKK